MIASYAAMVCTVCIILSPRIVLAQIPTVCASEGNLRDLTCCPGDCGSNNSRGECAEIGVPHNMTVTDVRSNWPHYFTSACNCSKNFAGVDCSRCKYGYYGNDCDQKEDLPRNSTQILTFSEQWGEYIDILRAARTYDSGYTIVLNESVPGTTDLNTTNTTLYDLFVWLHHFASKDSECKEGDDCIKVDYAHEATGFPTWHRQFILWFEWEIQYMLKSMGNPNYYKFRTHYWDWSQHDRSENIFKNESLGETVPTENNQPPLVTGELFNLGWDTVCWFGGSGGVNRKKGTICDPNVKTGPLFRCPFPEDCYSNNTNWPTIDQVNEAINKPSYDTECYDRNTTDRSFRNFMEGFEFINIDACDNTRLCKCEVGSKDCSYSNSSLPLQRHLHNTVHIILGIGDFATNPTTNMAGVMGDVSASPNDPIFINHHTMIDCILEEWLQSHPDPKVRVYPPDVPGRLKGHQREALIVPFFPIFKHSDMFQTADNFGYSCTLSKPPTAQPSRETQPSKGARLRVSFWILVAGIIFLLLSFY